MICPNISLKEVKDGFNEMIEALGGRPLTDEEFRSSELRNKRTGSDYSAMEAAYRSYHRNNGNMLDKAPNGNDSVLFNSLLEYFKGDRVAAIKAKANVYTNEFFNWFGDWLHQNPEEVITSEKETVNRDQNWVDGSEVILENGKYYYTNELGTKKEITRKEYDDFNSGKDIVLSEKVHKEKKYNHSNVLDKNGEPLIMYHVTTTKDIRIFDRAKSKHAGFWFSRNPNYYVKDSQNNPHVTAMPCFLNIREPNEIEHNLFLDAVDGDVTQESLDNTRFDGWITRYKHEPEFYGDTYSESAPIFAMATSPSQIKSAISNNGIFSTENDDIYHNLPIKNAAEEVKLQLLDRGLIHNFKGLRITKRVLNAERLVEEACAGTSVFPVFYQGLNSILVEFIDNVTIAEDLRDEIQRTNDKEIGAIMSMCRTLLQKIPQMKFDIIRPSKIPQGVRKNAISFVKGDTVYIVQGRGTTETVVEEFMHPIIHCIQAANTSLFEDLLKEAKHDFPKLWAEIKDTYTDKEGFNESDRANELVTQALSRYVHSGYSKALNRNRVKDLVKKALNHIVKLLNNAIQRIGGKYIVTPEDLPKMTLGLLSQLFLADDTQFRVWTSEEVKYNIISHLQKALQVADNITKRFNVLYRAYEKAPNKTPRKLQILNRIFETFNELKRSKDYHSIQIALNFALENLGSWDDATNTPDNIDSISGYLWLQSQLADPYSGITPEILVEMYSNSIGFYDNLISKYIPENIDDMMTEEDRKLKSQLKTLIDDIIKPMWLKAMAVVGDKIVDLIVDQEVTKSDFEKEQMKTVAKDWLHKNIMYGDISSVTAYLYNYSYSSNPIIKQAFHLILYAETKTLEEVQPIGRRITRVFQKANKGMKRIGPNWQTVLMEFDRDGIPTGNFVRDINYGQYEKDLEDFIKDLNKRFETVYKHTYIDDGNGCIINSLTGELAEDEEWENGIEPLYTTYMKEIERWKCEHANRRYTFSYYEERMSEPYKGSMDPNDVDVNKFGHGLSPKTLAKYNYIQSNINYYLDLCTDPKTGFSHPEELSIQDKKKLDDWQSQLEDLQNPYNPDGTPKLDEDRQMAFEIRAWLKWLGERLVTRIDLDSFNSEYQSVVNKAQQTNNPRLISDFMRYNSELGINPDFIELTIGLFANIKSSDQLAIHAELIRRSLQNLIKVENGYTRDLGRMENNPSFWLDCKRTDQIIEDSRLKQSEAFAKMFDENFYFEQIIYRDPNGFAIDANGNQVQPQDEAMHNDLLTYHEYMISKYTKDIYNSPTRTFPGLNDDQGNPIVFNGTINEVRSIVEKLFTYRKERTDMDGNIIVSDEPLSIFSMLKPRPDTFFNVRTGRTEPTFLQVPKGRFAEKHDHAGVYMNQDYDHKDLNSELPMRRYYDNTEAYNKVTKDADVEHLYDTLIEVMQEMLANYLSTNRRFNYRLPQVNAHTMQILSRITHQGFGNTMSKLWQSSTTVEENDESMRTNEDYATNPDGSIATDVPLKFVRKLKNPEDITTDVVGSVILFANMALNYKNKSEIDARIKALRFNLDFLNREELYKQTSKEDDEELAPNDNENSIKMFDSMANKHMYGNQWTGNPNQPKGSNKQANTNSWRGIASSALVTGTAFAGLGALFGFPLFGTITTGAILGGSLGTVIGGLLGAIQNGLFEGVALFKTIKNVLRIETSQTLALNIYSMLVGFGDSATRILKESLMGKYMTIRDILTSFAYVIWQTPRCILNIGNPLANNKLTRAMQLNGVSKGIHLTYEHLNYGRVRRVTSNLLMGGFSLLDWMANALLMRSFYNNVRFYDGDVVPKGFYSRYELEQAFMNAGHSKSAAKFAHMSCTTTLWGAYNSRMMVKDEYEPYVTARLKTQIRTKTLKRSALYNGMNPDNDVPIWKQDLIGGIVGALRSWLAQSMQHLYAGGVDNIVKEYTTESEQEVVGSKTKQKQKRKVRSITNEERSRLFAWDYETGTTQDQILIGIVRSFRTLSNWIQLHIFLFGGSKEDNTKAKLSEVEKYAWTDIIIYLGVLIAMMIGWTHVHDWASDVPKPEDRYHNSPVNLSPNAVYQYMRDVYIPREYYKLAVDNIMFRTIESLLTSFLPSSMSDIVSSVTALTNGVNEHLGLYGAIMDITRLSGHKLSDLIKQGGYKFYSRGERFGYKFIGPLDNLHTFLSYYGTVTNRDFYINTFGGAFKAFGYDFKKAKEESSKKGKSKKSTGSGFGGFDGGSGGGFNTGSGGFGGF